MALDVAKAAQFKLLLRAEVRDRYFTSADVDVLVSNGFMLDVTNRDVPVVRWVGLDSSGFLRVCAFFYSGAGWILHQVSPPIANEYLWIDERTILVL